MKVNAIGKNMVQKQKGTWAITVPKQEGILENVLLILFTHIT
jgi:hypothetical protein